MNSASLARGPEALVSNPESKQAAPKVAVGLVAELWLLKQFSKLVKPPHAPPPSPSPLPGKGEGAEKEGKGRVWA